MQRRAPSDRPLVSVLTPSFNQGRFLPDCLSSVAHQSYRPIEHVVCDGGSTDETLDVLRASTDVVRWTSEPDRGQSDALNKAFSRSNGEIIGWLNSDDAYFGPKVVGDAVALFRRHPEVDVLYGHGALVNAAGEILHFMWVPPFHYRLLRFVNFIVQPTAFVRRRALGETLVDPRYEHSMDRELWLRLGRTHRFKRLDAVVAIDRHQPDRKVYTRPDLARADEARLIGTYGISANAKWPLVRKAYRVAARVVGARLIPAAFQPHAFDARTDGVPSLLARQLVTPRRAMRIDADASGR